MRGAAVVVLCAAAAAVGWWFLAPPALGGRTSLVIVDGTSMLPTLDRDDLVLVRRSPSYRVGDIVAYHSASIHRVVLHRIVAVRGGLYSFKGDNNSFLDPETPPRSALIGKRWLTIPMGGRAARVVQTPWVAAVVAGALVIVWGLGALPAPPRAPV